MRIGCRPLPLRPSQQLQLKLYHLHMSLSVDVWMHQFRHFSRHLPIVNHSHASIIKCRDIEW